VLRDRGVLNFEEEEVQNWKKREPEGEESESSRTSAGCSHCRTELRALLA